MKFCLTAYLALALVPAVWADEVTRANDAACAHGAVCVNDTADEELMTADLFAGTVSQQDGQWTLRRCDMLGNDYRLSFANELDRRHIASLNTRFPPDKRPNFWVRVTAEYREGRYGHELRVLSIVSAKGNESCHLTDYLSEMAEPK